MTVPTYSPDKRKTAIIFVARPGGGKGTVEKGFQDRGIHYRELPFRALLDKEVSSKSPLGLKIDGFRKQGRLVPNDIILPIVDEAFGMVSDTNLLILDGFPRNEGQLDFAVERLNNFGYERIIVLYVDTPPFTCIRRLAKRGRDDQDTDPENIATRQEVFERETMPVIIRFRCDAEKLKVRFFMVDGENLRTNLTDYIRMLGIDWMITK